MKKLYLTVALVMLAVILMLSACSQAAPATTYTQPKTTIPAVTKAAPTYGPAVTVPAPTYTLAPSAPSKGSKPPVVITQVPAPVITIPSASGGSYPYKQPGSDTIGLATGGAKDINNFRQNISNNYLPLPTDITCEGLFYDYYFDTGIQEATNKLFAPSYSFAATRDPLSGQTEYYLAVGLNSGMKEEDFSRKKLNLVIVLDSSGSMGEIYNRYYYDRFGQQQDAYEGEGVARPTKMDTAKDAVVSVLNQLEDGDRFTIVLFNSTASLVKSMALVRNTNMRTIIDNVLDIRAGGSTDMSAGMKIATEQFRNLLEVNSYDYENRIILLTDAQPNTGDTSSSGMMGTVTKNAANRIYTTFIGIGVDFNSTLIEEITSAKGANYYSVHSPREFRERVAEEFDFMVTPLVFNLRLNFESKGWRIEKVFGSPEADQATGQLMKINTLFPSRNEGGETKGGIVLLKLRKMTSLFDDKVYLKVSYEDRNGRSDSSQETIQPEGTSPEHFDNSGIRKAVLLSRYAALLQNWMIDERQHIQYSKPWEPTVREDTGIIIPPDPYLSQWERSSLPLTVSASYKRIFRNFSQYFKSEWGAIGDDTLYQEMEILTKLSR
jgi:Ca-activated chloride channel family protein